MFIVGFGSVRPYLCGPTSLTAFIQGAFDAGFIESNEGGPTLLKIGDSLLWVEAGELPPHIKAWVGLVYVYVPNVIASTLVPWSWEREAFPSQTTSRTTSARPALWMLVATRGGYRLTWSLELNSPRKMPPNPSPLPTCYGWLRQPAQVAELKR